MINGYVTFGVILTSITCTAIMLAGKDGSAVIKWAAVIACGSFCVQVLNLNGAF